MSGPGPGESPVPGAAAPPGGPGMAGLLVTHGALGAALKSAAERISGPAEDVVAFSNEGVSPEQLTETLRGHLSTLAGPVLLMVDLAGGSTLAAAQRACRGRADTHVLAGVNLPVLLDFLQKRGRLSAADLVAHVLDRGHAGLRLVPPPAC